LVPDSINAYSSSILVDTNSITKKDTTSLPLSKNGPETKVVYSAKDSIELDNAKQVLHLYGNAKVVYGEMTIEADRIIIYLETNQVTAFGKKDSTGKMIEKVRFQDGEQFFLAPEMKYDFKTQKGKIKQIYTQEGDLHLHAKQAKKMPDNNIFVKHGKITTCDHEDPHFYFSASKLKVIPGKVMVAGPTHLVVRGFHTPIWVPFGIFPNNAEKQSGIIIPSQGTDGNQSGISELGYHWAVNDFLHLEFLGSIYFGGNYKLTGDAKYIKKYKYNGNLRFAHNNTVAGIPDITGHLITKDYNIVWNHSQDLKAHPKSRFTAFVDAKTNSFNSTKLATAENANSLVEATSNSQLTWNWTEKWGQVTVLSSLNQNLSTKAMTITAPSMTVNVPTKTLYKNLQISASANFHNSIAGTDSIIKKDWKNLMKNGIKATTNIDIGQSFAIPLPILKHINFSLPSLIINGYANTKIVTRDVVNDSVQHNVANTIKAAYDFQLTGVTATTKWYGTYGMKKGMLFEAFRHVVTPEVRMSYTPDFYIDAQDIKRTYVDPETGEVEEYSIYDNTYSLNQPKATEQLNLSYSLRNILQAKLRTKADTVSTYKKITLIDNLGITGRYNFLAKEHKWSDISIGVSAHPAFLKNFDVGVIISPYALDSIGTKTNTLLWDSLKQIGRLTSFRLAPSLDLKRSLFKKKDDAKTVFNWNMGVNYTFTYSKTGIADATTQNSLGLSGSITFTDNWKVTYNAPVSIKTKSLTATSMVKISRKLHCWVMEVTWFPFATQDVAQYTFTIRPESGLLADLKYEKKQRQGQLF